MIFVIIVFPMTIIKMNHQFHFFHYHQMRICCIMIMIKSYISVISESKISKSKLFYLTKSLCFSDEALFIDTSLDSVSRSNKASPFRKNAAEYFILQLASAQIIIRCYTFLKGLVYWSDAEAQNKMSWSIGTDHYKMLYIFERPSILIWCRGPKIYSIL